jgi:hypothetical protein
MATKKNVAGQENDVIKGSKTVTIKALETIPNFDPTLVSNPNLPTLFADMVQLLNRSDGFGILRFFSRIPGANIEVARVSLSHELLKNIATILCHNLNYYPTPNKDEKIK